jgi:hypothetical protein
MSQISKAQLTTDNSLSFPDNNSGYITPLALRNFNINLIDSTVNQTGYTADSGSWNRSINALNTYTASFAPSLTQLNAFTASQLTINTGVNGFTQSATGRLNNLESTTSSLNTFSSSINQILVNGASIGTSTRFFFSGFATASIVPNVNGAIAVITILSDPSLTTTASFNSYTASTAATQTTFSSSVATSFSQSSYAFNQYTASTNTFTASAQTSINQLLGFSASLDATYATDAQLTTTASILQANIDTKLNSASFNTYTQSFSQSVATSFSQSYSYINTYTASTNASIANINQFTSSVLAGYATTGSNVFVGNQTFTGSVFQNVSASSITSQTASIDLSKANYFTLTLAGTTNINVINAQPGVTATLVINTSTSPSASFSNNVKQPSGSAYVASPSGNIDIISFTAVNSTTVFAFPAQSFV